MSTVDGTSVLLLKNDRRISSRRLWGIRIVVALVLASLLVQSGGAAVVAQPYRFAGSLAFLAVLYWVGLWLLSAPTGD